LVDNQLPFFILSLSSQLFGNRHLYYIRTLL